MSTSQRVSNLMKQAGPGGLCGVLMVAGALVAPLPCWPVAMVLVAWLGWVQGPGTFKHVGALVWVPYVSLLFPHVVAPWLLQAMFPFQGVVLSAVALSELRDWATVNELLGLLCVGAVGITHVLFPDITAYWFTTLKSMAQAAGWLPGGHHPDGLNVLAAYARLATGIKWMVLATYVLLATWVGVRCQAMLDPIPSAPSPRLSASRSSLAYSLFFVLVFVLAWGLGIAWAWDALPMAGWPLMVSGVAAAHRWAGLQPRLPRPLSLLGVYGSLVFLSPFSALFFVGLGWVQGLARLRATKLPPNVAS